MSDSTRFFLPVLRGIAIVGLLLTPTVTNAHSIDGNWCNSVGKYLNIDGPNIVTPRGNKLVGTYSRNDFSYVPPAGEDHAGKTLSMSQLSEEQMEMRLPDGKIEPWTRCDVVS